MPHEPVDIAEVRKLCRNVPCGPWSYSYSPDCQCPHSVMGSPGIDSGKTSIASSIWTHEYAKPTMEFIAASRTLVPAMADEIERLRRLLERVEESMVDYGYAHGDECGCEQCEILSDVRRVNKETTP